MKNPCDRVYCHLRRWVVVLSLALTAGCAPAAEVSQAPDPGVAAEGVGPVFETMEHRIRVVTIAEGMSFPHSMAFLPDGGMLLTQLNGQIRLLRNGVLSPEPVGTVGGLHSSEGAGAGSGGLMDVILHPEFAENQWAYFVYNKTGEAGATMAVARGVFDGNAFGDIADVFVADASTDRGGHLSARIAFAPDGMLFVAVSDRSIPELAQDMSSHAGKVLRIRDDGTVPEDNPFVGMAGHLPEIFTIGHRNLHGMAVHPVTGHVWINEHGDEVNILEPGANYGWPYLSVAGAGGGSPTMEAPRGMDLKGPYISWNPSLNISGLMFYTGDRFPGWQGDLFVGGLSTEQVHRVEFSPDSLGPLFTQIREALFTDIGQRVRDLKQGPDGLIYFTTYDAESGSVMRIEPAG